MRIPDQQLDLFAERLAAIVLGRRAFLKAVGAMAAFGGLGFATTAPAAATAASRGRWRGRRRASWLRRPSSRRSAAAAAPR